MNQTQFHFFTLTVNLAGTLFESKTAMETQKTTIYGIVVPTEWDDQGNILRIAIVTYDVGKEFIANKRVKRFCCASLWRFANLIL